MTDGRGPISAYSAYRVRDLLVIAMICDTMRPVARAVYGGYLSETDPPDKPSETCHLKRDIYQVPRAIRS